MVFLSEQGFNDNGADPDAMEVFVISLSSMFANKWINVNRGQLICRVNHYTIHNP